jgi:hypothetical protein
LRSSSASKASAPEARFIALTKRLLVVTRLEHNLNLKFSRVHAPLIR